MKTAGLVWPMAIVVWCGLLTGVRGAVNPAALNCENQTDPLGIDAASPGLSWRLEGDGRGLRQTAYRVLVASSAKAWPEMRAICGTAVAWLRINAETWSTAAGRWSRASGVSGRCGRGIKMESHRRGAASRNGPWDSSSPATGRRNGSVRTLNCCRTTRAQSHDRLRNGARVGNLGHCRPATGDGQFGPRSPRRAAPARVHVRKARQTRVGLALRTRFVRIQHQRPAHRRP